MSSTPRELLDAATEEADDIGLVVPVLEHARTIAPASEFPRRREHRSPLVDTMPWPRARMGRHDDAAREAHRLGSDLLVANVARKREAEQAVERLAVRLPVRLREAFVGGMRSRRR